MGHGIGGAVKVVVAIGVISSNGPFEPLLALLAFRGPVIPLFALSPYRETVEQPIAA